MACERFRTNLAIVELLIKSGADLNASDSSGNAPLHLLLFYFDPKDEEDFSTIRLLLDRGAHLDQVNHQGKTAVDLCGPRKEFT